MQAHEYDKEYIKQSIIGKLQRYDGCALAEATEQQIYKAVASTVRDQIRFRLSMKTRYAVDVAKERAAEFGIPSQVLDIIYRLPDMTTEEKDTVMSELGLPEDIFSRLFPVFPSCQAF